MHKGIIFPELFQLVALKAIAQNLAMDNKSVKSQLRLIFTVDVFIQLSSYGAAVKARDTLSLGASLTINQTFTSKNLHLLHRLTMQPIEVTLLVLRACRLSSSPMPIYLVSLFSAGIYGRQGIYFGR